MKVGDLVIVEGDLRHGIGIIVALYSPKTAMVAFPSRKNSWGSQCKTWECWRERLEIISE